MKHLTRVLGWSLIVCFSVSISALGQARQPPPSAPIRVRVINNRSPILDSSRVTPVTYLDAGAELIFVSEQGNWIEVLLPGMNPRRETGFIARSNLAPPFGPPRTQATPPQTAEPETPPVAAAPPAAPQSPQAPREAPRSPTPPVQRSTSAPRVSLLGTGIRGFGNVAAGSFLARQSFDAVYGKATLRGPWVGAGVQFQSGHGPFFEASLDYFRKTGQRVFVNNGEVFQLGIEDTLTIVPVTATIGYRFRGRAIGPFVGGGIGQYLSQEKTPFDESSEHEWKKANSFHALGGVEFHLSHNLGVAAQVRYTRVPDGLTNGVAPAFDESDLGGVQLGVKVLLRR